MATQIQKRADDQRRYLSSNSTQTAFELTAGRSASSPASSTTAHERDIVALGDGFRGARIQVFGAGSDNQTINGRVWLVRRGMASDGSFNPGATSPKGDYELEFYGSFVATLSAALGGQASGAPVLSTERIADTIVWTLGSTSTSPKGVGTLIESNNGLGTSYAYSPADDTPAKLSIPDMDGAYGFVIEFDLGTATSANAVVERTP